MERHLLGQIVALVVVLSALLRWLPVDDPRDPLGRGDPLRAVQLDLQLRQWWNDPDRMRAYLLALRRPSAAHVQYWHDKLRRVRAIREGAGADTFVQFKGVPRNIQWSLVYDLYPIRTVGAPLEEGSSESDPTLPGAEVMLSGTILDDMTPAQLEEVRRGKRPHPDASLPGESGG